MYVHISSLVCGAIERDSAEIECLEHTLVHVALLLFSCFCLFDLHVEELYLLLHDGYLLLIILFLCPVLLLDAVQILKALVASVLQSLVNHVFVAAADDG